MRFAYIDSQGNEVSIPSVDALALRIELGAIGPDTDLYDAQADRWGPAQSHEIFHTLSREVGGEGTFVAPPPPPSPPPAPEPPQPPVEAPSPPPPPPPQAAPSPWEAEDASTDEPPDAPPTDPEPSFDLTEPLSFEGGPEVEEPAAPPAADPTVDLAFDLTPADADGLAADHDEPAEFGFDLADPEMAAPAPPTAKPAEDAMSFDFAAPEPAAPAPPPAPEAPPSFDFGDGLELAPEPFTGVADDADEGPEESSMDFGGGFGGGFDDDDDDDDDDAEGSSMDFGGGFGGGFDDELALEQPMSEFTPEAPPSWMEESTPDDGSMDFTPGGVEEDEAEPPRPRKPAPADESADGATEYRRPKREPVNRPSPPKRVRRKSPAGAIMAVMGVAVVGAGGYFGWQMLQTRQAPAPVEPTAPALPEVTIPDIPAELLPQMRDLGEAALAGMVGTLREMQAEFDLPAEPNPEWLAGVYLANATQFGDVAAFWEGIEAYVGRVRDVDTQVFHEQYLAQLEAAGVVGDTAAMLLARADSGFLATREDRFEAYAQMGDLVNAALDLHAFLIDNEANIAYEPAAGGISRDPVLEAVPSTRELGNEMWTMVDRITGALDALGTLDKVTTERLTAVLYDRIRRAGFR